jgi:hypothetical protein
LLLYCAPVGRYCIAEWLVQAAPPLLVMAKARGLLAAPASMGVHVSASSLFKSALACCHASGTPTQCPNPCNAAPASVLWLWSRPSKVGAPYFGCWIPPSLCCAGCAQGAPLKVRRPSRVLPRAHQRVCVPPARVGVPLCLPMCGCRPALICLDSPLHTSPPPLPLTSCPFVLMRAARRPAESVPITVTVWRSKGQEACMHFS